MIPGDLLSAFPHRQFHTLPGLLDSLASLPNSNPNACMPMQGGSLYHFYFGLRYDSAERRTHDLPCERRHATDWANPTRITLSYYSLNDIPSVWKWNMQLHLTHHMRTESLWMALYSHVGILMASYVSQSSAKLPSELLRCMLTSWKEVSTINIRFTS